MIMHHASCSPCAPHHAGSCIMHQASHRTMHHASCITRQSHRGESSRVGAPPCGEDSALAGPASVRMGPTGYGGHMRPQGDSGKTVMVKQ